MMTKTLKFEGKETIAMQRLKITERREILIRENFRG